MSKNVAVFVDVANLYYAARGQDVDVDYVALLKHATKGRDLIRAYAYSGLDPENENQKKFLDFLGKNGYKVVAKDIRKFGDGRVKANLDIELVVDLFKLADRMDVAVIVSGDGDFAPAIRALQDQGVRCEVISFKPNTSSDLFAVADEFVDAMKISSIGRQKDAKGVGAPEMPAKEVNPDVGFREASPSVAAAAVAAFRGNGEEPVAGGRGRARTASGRRADRPSRSTRSGPGRTAEATPVPAEAAASGAGAATDGEAGRRRRRRGGRGRGRRGRRGDLVEEASVPSLEAAEVTWQEVDSLEELEGLAGEAGPESEHEYGFEEADAETLAALGLSGQPATTPLERETEAPVPQAAEPAKPRSRRRTGGGAAKAAGAKAAKTTTATRATKPSTARSRAKAATKPPVDDAEASPAETTRKPRAARSPHRKTSAATEAPTTTPASDEGIWKRFTSGRPRRGTAKPASES